MDLWRQDQFFFVWKRGSSWSSLADLLHNTPGSTSDLTSTKGADPRALKLTVWLETTFYTSTQDASWPSMPKSTMRPRLMVPSRPSGQSPDLQAGFTPRASSNPNSQVHCLQELFLPVNDRGEYMSKKTKG